MSFSEVYESALQPFVKEYEEARNQKGRKAVLKNAAKAVLDGKDLLEDQGVDLPKDLETVCGYYFILCLLRLMLWVLGHHALYQKGS
jgi:hypothetical protein